MAQKFEGFSDMCTKAHGIELHLNKKKKPAKVSAMDENIIAALVHPKANPTLTLEARSSKGWDQQSESDNNPP